MRQSEKFTDNFKPNLEYERVHPAQDKRDYPWKRTPLGRGCLVLIGLIGDQMAGEKLVFTRKFPSEAAISMAFETYCPWFPEEYFSKTNKILVDKIIYHRFHKMYYFDMEDRTVRGQRSGEHYENHNKLRPLVRGVHEMWRKGGVITREALLAVAQGTTE